MYIYGVFLKNETVFMEYGETKDGFKRDFKPV